MIFKILIFTVILLGIFLRFHAYTEYPPRGASSDEYTYTFLGMSLLTTGIPTSWSYFDPYPVLGDRHDIVIDNIRFPIVTPYFDHPPLNGLLVGGWALINGQDTFEEVKLGTIRQVPIALWAISAFLLYLIGLKLYEKKTVFWGLLIYATGTLSVMETRTVFAENLLTPLMLGSLLLYLNVRKKINLKHIILLSLLGGLSFWAKELGVSVAIATILLLIADKINAKLILTYSIFCILFVSLYALYGYYYNWPLFTSIIAIQSLRELGPNVLNILFFNPIIVNETYFDGWYLLGFVSFFASFLDLKKNQLLLIPSFAYFFMMIFSLTQHGEMGWYMIPLFPFFSILTANLFNESIKKNVGFIVVTSLFVGLFIIRYYYEAKFGLPPIIFRLFLLALFGPVALFIVLRRQTLLKIFSEVLFYSFIVMTIYITYYYIHPL